MKNKALIVGSVAYDVIFPVHGKIMDEIPLKEGKIEAVNMMFTAKNKSQYFGGTGGNIAYGLGLLKANPELFSLVGSDFLFDYKPHLEKLGVDIKVVVNEKSFTATYYGISDELKHQIGIWQPNVYSETEESSLNNLSEQDLQNVKVAIFSPGTGKTIYKHMKELRDRVGDEVKIIFDPGQILSIFYTKDLLKETLDLADILILNDIEMAQLTGLFGYTIDDVLKTNTKCFIETKGANGSTIYGENVIHIPAVKASKVVEVTGAGDAYRAGFIYGLLQDKSIEASCKLGSIMGARNVETNGGQNYTVDLRDF
jgi:adenosine kinase